MNDELSPAKGQREARTNRAVLIQLIAAIMIGMAVVACGFLPGGTAPTQDISTIVAATLAAMGPPTTQAQPTPPPPNGLNVAEGSLHLLIQPDVATGASIENVPAVSDQGGPPWNVAPDFQRLTLQGYALQDRFFQPQMMVYPAPEYAAASAAAAESIQRLQAVLASPSDLPGNDAFPQLPYANAAQIIGAAPKIVPFKGGTGLRVLAEYAQFTAPVNNHELFYHFQGITADGKYYVIAVLPISSPLLAETSDPGAAIPSGGVPFPGYDSADASVFQAYYEQVATALQSASPDSFKPSLTQLDALIGSLEVAP
jgi:hypothetical protein